MFCPHCAFLDILPTGLLSYLLCMLMHKVGGMSTGDPYGIEIHLVDPVHFSRAKLEKPPAALSPILMPQISIMAKPKYSTCLFFLKSEYSDKHVDYACI